MSIAPGYLTAYFLGNLNFIELRFKYVESPPNETTHRMIPISRGQQLVDDNIWTPSDISEWLEYTFDYARDSKSEGVSADRVICLTDLGIVMRYVRHSYSSKVFVPFDGNHITPEICEAIMIMANNAIEMARLHFEDADADKIRADIKELKHKLKKLEEKLPC